MGAFAATFKVLSPKKMKGDNVWYMYLLGVKKFQATPLKYSRLLCLEGSFQNLQQVTLPFLSENSPKGG